MENAFGLLCVKFGVFKRTMELDMANAVQVVHPGEKPRRLCKDLTKIFKDEDLHRILERSLKDLQRFYTLGIPPYNL